MHIESDRGDDPNERFRTNVRATRESRGLSQSQLSDALRNFGYTWPQSTIQRIETGQRRVDVGEAHALADALGVPITTLLSTLSPLDSSHTAKVRRALQTLDDADTALHHAQRHRERARHHLAELKPATITDDDELRSAALAALTE